MEIRELALFAGAGGGILGGVLLGWRTVCAVEIDPYCRKVLLQRQQDGILKPFPIWDDVKTFDGKPWRGHVDVISGGFPCQDISCAGKGAGIGGDRSGLWSEMARIIGEVQPRFAFVENSPMLTIRGLGRVLGDLSEMGFNAEWGVVGADDAGAPHRRKRIWILAHSTRFGRQQTGSRQSGASSQVCYTNGDSEPTLPLNAEVGDVSESLADSSGIGGETLGPEGRKPQGTDGTSGSGECVGVVSDADRKGLPNRGQAGLTQSQSEAVRGVAFSQSQRRCGAWWSTEPSLGRVAHGVANRVDRLRAIGNGQVPEVARLAFRILSQRFSTQPRDGNAG